MQHRPGLFASIILGLVIPCLVIPSLGATLSEDSARFASYWSKIENGDSAGAADYLMGLGGDKDCLGQMANFLLAWREYSAGNYAQVPVFLDMGIPSDLADHGWWLRADALCRSGQQTLANPYLDSLVSDSESVFFTDALLQSATNQADAGRLNEFLELADRYDRASASSEDRQRLDLRAAQALAEMGSHDLAVNRLWAGYLLDPGSTAARSLQAALKSYSQRYGYAPRGENAAEVLAEMQAIEDHTDFTFGLLRIAEASPDTGADLDALTFWKGRFQSGLGRHRDAVQTLQEHAKTYPHSPFLARAEYFLGRSAYLTDQDSIAIPALKTAADSAVDAKLAGKALDLLGTLHLDRGKPSEAVTDYQLWEVRARGTSAEPDCLWKLGWALWEAGRAEEAAQSWGDLAASDSSSEYLPSSLYWSSRALTRFGRVNDADSLRKSLWNRFPFSYYTVISGGRLDSNSVQPRPLLALGVDEIHDSGGVHSRKFALLAAMRLSDLAKREWSPMFTEMSDRDALAWWKVQLLLWQNDRLGAYGVIRSRLGNYLRSAGERPADFNDVAYPLDFDPQIVQLSKQWNVDPYFIFGLICQESHYEPRIASGAGAVGLMQLMPPTARIQARKIGLPYSAARLRDPDYNLKIGIAHVAHLLADFNGDTVLVLAAYNAGPSAAQAWFEEFGDHDPATFVERIPYRETRLFIKRNIEHRAAYRRLYPDVGGVSGDSLKTAPQGN